MAVATRDEQLWLLYSRFKSLSIAVSAALILDQPLDELAAEVDALTAECSQAAAATDAPDPALVECVESASALSALLPRAATGTATTHELESLREAHRRLRRRVWDVLPCEYVPCCAGGTHTHRGE
jgi:hypothetical protein